jgi:hypothetical protein
MSDNRGSKPGEKRGGRQEGTPNKKTQVIAERLEALGCDPIEGMARIAIDESVDISIRAQLYIELARYTYPKCAPEDDDEHIEVFPPTLDLLTALDKTTGDQQP